MKLQKNKPEFEYRSTKQSDLESEKDSSISSNIFYFDEIETKSLISSEINHYRLENDLLLEKYGSEIYKKIKIQEMSQINFNILSNHNISPKLRARLVDWIMEIHIVLDISATTYFKSVHILDTYLINTKETIKNISLLGMVCVFIAAKFEGEQIGISYLYENIGHEKIPKKEILAKEIEVLKGIGMENIMSTSTLECITIFIYDFEQNNVEFLPKHELHVFIDHLKLDAIYIAELLLHFDEFNAYECIYKSLGCIFSAFHRIRDQIYKLNNQEKNYFDEWLIFVFEQNPYDEPYKKNCRKICEALEKYDNLDCIDFNIGTNYFNEVKKLRKSPKHIDCKACKIHQ